MVPSDTTLEAARQEFEILRKLGSETRAQMSFELSDNLRDLVEAGIRLRHPEFDQKKVKSEVLRLMISMSRFIRTATRNIFRWL